MGLAHRRDQIVEFGIGFEPFSPVEAGIPNVIRIKLAVGIVLIGRRVFETFIGFPGADGHIIHPCLSRIKLLL
ncbi:hypothetical protein D1872_299260 [compost metagenome]